MIITTKLNLFCQMPHRFLPNFKPINTYFFSTSSFRFSLIGVSTDSIALVGTCFSM